MIGQIAHKFGIIIKMFGSKTDECSKTKQAFDDAKLIHPLLTYGGLAILQNQSILSIYMYHNMRGFTVVLRDNVKY